MAINICIKCRIVMAPKRNGVIARWRRRRCVSGDVYACPKCGVDFLHVDGILYVEDTPRLGAEYVEVKE